MTMFLSLSLVFFLLWFFLLFLSRTTRKEQLVMSFVGLVLSPAVLLVSLGDVQGAAGVSPTGIGIEDFLFSFSFFGIAAVIYQALLGKRMKPWKGTRAILIHPIIHWFAHLVVVLALWIGISFGLMAIFTLTSFQSFAIGGLLIGTYVIAHRHDLLLNAIVSGCLVAILLFLLEQIFFFRLSEQVGGAIAQSISVEELVWAWVVGFAIGPLYEYLRHKKLV